MTTPQTELLNGAIALFDDATVYSRTAAGQHELITNSSRLSRAERQMLAVVTGLTSLRVLLDIVMLADASNVIRRLVKDGLIEKVEPSRVDRSPLDLYQGGRPRF